MKKYYLLVLACIVVLTFGSCASFKSKSYTKKAVSYEQNGLLNDASHYYMEALLKKMDNIDAKVGMKRCGQALLDEKLQKFSQAYDLGDNQQAVDLYTDAENYRKSVQNVGVEIIIASQYTQYYEEAKNVFLDDKYVESTNYFDEENFAAAAKGFQQIVDLNPNFRDAADKLKTSICEPLYRVAATQMSSKKFRTAYATILTMQKQYQVYKDIVDLKNECLQKGRVVIVFPSLQASGQDAEVAKLVYSQMFKAIQNINSPFIDIRNNNSSKETSNNVLTIRSSVNDFNYNLSRRKVVDKRGYLKKCKKVTREDGTNETVCDYQKITYQTVSQTAQLSINLSLKLVNQKNNSLLSNESRLVEQKDEVYYASYDGNYRDLVQGSWDKQREAFNSKTDRIDDNYTANQQLKALFEASKEPKSRNALLDDAVSNFMAPVISSIKSYLSNE